MLACQNTRDQPGGGPAVAHIQCFCRSTEAVESPAVDIDDVIFLTYFNAHRPETVDGGKTVGALQKTMDFCDAFCQGAEHHSPVTDGFVSGNAQPALEILCSV